MPSNNLPLLMEGYQEFSASTIQFINESGEPVKPNSDGLWLNESNKPSKELYLTGVFQREEVENGNGRRYPKGMFQKRLSESAPAMLRLKEGAMAGHLEHPADGLTNLKKIAIRVCELKVDGTGTVFGKALVLETTDGKDAAALYRGGVKVGISSRGRGTVGPNGVVNEDYELETFDLVSKPSTPGAYPKESSASQPNTSVSESTNNDSFQETPMSFNLQTFESSVRPLLEQRLEDLQPYQRGDVANRLMEATSTALTAIKADSTLAAVLNPLIQEMNTKRLASTKAADLTEKVKELEKNLSETAAKLSTAEKERDAAVELCESLSAEYKTRVEELCEAAGTLSEGDDEEGDEDADEDGEDDSNDSEYDEEGDDTDESEDADSDPLAEAIRIAAAERGESNLWKLKYEAAVELIEALLGKPAPKNVVQTVEGLIAQHPLLAESKDLLLSQQSPEKAVEVAESITKAVSKATSKSLDESDKKPEARPLTEDGKDSSAPAGSSDDDEKPPVGFRFFKV